MNTSQENIVVRMAPSPTGLFHVGSLRTTIFNYLFARKHGGKFILRIEDTDKERSKKVYEENILESLEWLGLSYDELYKQSERTPIYKDHLKKLIEADLAYEAEENNSKTGKVIRFKNPNATITFTDIVLGEISFDTTELGDFVIARDMDNPLYHFTVIVDDGEMGITHVIRGQDHISNTPRQIALLEACGFERPQYAHLPLILAPDKTKMSKRHGSVSVSEYKEKGYLKEALINFMAFIGWNPGGEDEVFTLHQLIQLFDLENVHKSAGVFNLEKLDWINREWLKKMDDETFIEYIRSTTEPLWSQSEETFLKLVPLIRERISHTAQLQEMIDIGEYDYFFTDINYDASSLVWKDTLSDIIADHLSHIHEILSEVNKEQWNSEYVKSLIWPYAEEKGKGEVLAPFRFALSGKDRSPDPFTLSDILGKDTTLMRISQALTGLKKLN